MTDFKDFFFKRIINRRNFTYRNLIECLDSYLKKGDKVLDAGCGKGNLSMYMASKGAFVFGIDISEESIEECKRKAANLGLERMVNFQTANIEKGRIRGTFNLISCFEVLEHVNNYRIVIKRFSELLKPNGILIISVPSLNAPLYKLNLLEGKDKLLGHLRRYTKEDLMNLCESEGLRVVEAKSREGILRNFLFFTNLGNLPLRLANRFELISDILTFLDNITLKLFGESQIIVVAQKPRKERK
jgi:ubiquinone biosynthesis O-methyltransferase